MRTTCPYCKKEFITTKSVRIFDKVEVEVDGNIYYGYVVEELPDMISLRVLLPGLAYDSRVRTFLRAKVELYPGE